MCRGWDLKSQKLIPSKENLSVLIAEISSCQTSKITNLQKETPAKIPSHMVLDQLLFQFLLILH